MNTFNFSSMTAAVVAATLLAGCAHRAGDQGPIMGSGTGNKHEMGTMPMHDECSAEMQEKQRRMAEQHAKNRDQPDPGAPPRMDCPMMTP